ncbi:HTH_Tnp_Tc3_2 domain-containing protein [Trichonephila clavipes]|nr:HTH_Tnp_Tc3_2 domain-containing protein [Trichonephila clavipes]
MSSRWCAVEVWTLRCRPRHLTEPDGHGYELVSSVRALVPQKFSVEEELMHVKHVEVKGPHVGVMWKFGRGVISSGRPRVTTSNKEGYLESTAKRNSRSTASDLSRQLSSATGTTVSRQTVYRRLGHIGLYARRPVRCVPLTATHCHLRLTWSREHALWTPQQWSCVMFSDESRFSLQSDSRRTLIWKAPGTRYHQENTIERTATVVQDGSFGEELFLVPELTCMFRV